MFLEGPTIGFDGFSMVFEILRAMVNDGLEVNNGLHVPSHKKVRKINSRQNANFKQSTQMNISSLDPLKPHILYNRGKAIFQ